MERHGGQLHLGKANGATTVSKLTASIAGPALTLVNQSTNAAATALNISVAPGQAPLKVNAEAGTATNLSADKIDGKSSSEFAAGVNGKATDAAHADQADNATNANNADTVDGKHAADFYQAGSKVADTDTLDGLDSTQVKPLTASVGRNGELVGGSGVHSVYKEVGGGTYEVRFNRTVSNCVRVASIGTEVGFYYGPSNHYMIPSGEVTTFSASSDKIGVLTRASDGFSEARPFHLAVFC